jgi:hypothetical protein
MISTLILSHFFFFFGCAVNGQKLGGAIKLWGIWKSRLFCLPTPSWFFMDYYGTFNVNYKPAKTKQFGLC